METTGYERMLRARREELAQRLHRIEEDFERPRNPDDDDRALERSNDEVLEELGLSGQAELRAIDAALGRIAEGRFGTCVRCGGPIAERRLSSLPHTPLCQHCAAG